MRQIHYAFSQRTIGVAILTLTFSFTTGCFLINGNGSIRGGDIPLTPQGTLSDHHEALVRLIEKEDPTLRSTEDEQEKSFHFKKSVMADIGDSCDGSKDCSHEKITYDSIHCKQIGPCEADLFVLEFDDQGRLYHPHQMEHLFNFLKDTMSPKSECEPSDEKPCFDDVSIIVAAHGWRHNADFEDWNLRQLREVLYSAVLFEAHKSSKDELWNPSNKPRRVVGVYLGWRGALIKEYPNSPRIPFTTSWTLSDIALGLPALLSFWDRKGAALDVALGSTRELFARLGHVRASVNDMSDNASMMGRPRKWYDSCRERAQKRDGRCVAMRTLILGHSFGSLAIYNAISESLIDSVSGGIISSNNDPSANELVSSPYADLIVLINPAFEGARFEPLYQASLNRMKRSRYLPTQDPVLVLITGTSDSATRYAFPIGRFFSTLFQDNSPESKDGRNIGRRAKEERSANWKTVGHIPRYMTHYLDSFPTFSDIEPKKDTDSSLDICLKTGWEQLASTGLPGNISLADTLDENAKVWKQKLQASIETKSNWPARTFCGGLRLSAAMQEAQEGEDPLDDLSNDQSNPSSNQLLTNKILPDNTRSPHNPIWVVRTRDKNIIDGHNGFLNPRMEGFIQQLYREVLNPQ